MNREAIVIGCTYDGHERFTPLPGVSHDVGRAKQVLGKAGYKVSPLLEPAKADVLGTVEKAAKRVGKGGLLLVYFAGHGLLIQGRHVLVCPKARWNEFEYFEELVPIDQLRTRTAKAGIHLALILDCCRNSPLRDRSAGKSDFHAETLGKGTSRDVAAVEEVMRSSFGYLSACSDDEVARELPRNPRCGLFSYALFTVLDEALSKGERIFLDDQLRERVGRHMRELAVEYDLPPDARPCSQSNIAFPLIGEPAGGTAEKGGDRRGEESKAPEDSKTAGGSKESEKQKNPGDKSGESAEPGSKSGDDKTAVDKSRQEKSEKKQPEKVQAEKERTEVAKTGAADTEAKKKTGPFIIPKSNPSSGGSGGFVVIAAIIVVVAQWRGWIDLRTFFKPKGWTPTTRPTPWPDPPKPPWDNVLTSAEIPGWLRQFEAALNKRSVIEARLHRDKLTANQLKMTIAQRFQFNELDRRYAALVGGPVSNIAGELSGAPDLDLGGGVKLALRRCPPPLAGIVAGSAAAAAVLGRPYYLGAREVTRGQFARFVQEERYRTVAEAEGRGWLWPRVRPRFGVPAEQEEAVDWRDARFGDDTYPVVMVARQDADAFCRWLTAKTGRTVRLPTAAEWQRACTAGGSEPWAGGNQGLVGLANVADQSLASVHPLMQVMGLRDGHAFAAPAGTFKANAWGLHDLYGNVAEWVAPGPDDWGDVRVGGSWLDNGERFTSPERARQTVRSGFRDDHTGFRILVEIP